MKIMPQVFVFEKKLCTAETNGSKMIKFGPNQLKMVAMCRSRCDQGITKRRKCLIRSDRKRNGYDAPSVLFRKKSDKKLKPTIQK